MKSAKALPVGTVVVNTWGYDQTNVDFYQVVSATACFVTLRMLKAETTETGFMCGPTTPVLFSFMKEETSRHKVVPGLLLSGHEGPSINFKHGSGVVWNGQPQRCSWYA